MTYEIKLTVQVTGDCTLSESTQRIKRALLRDQRNDGIVLISIDKAERAKQQ